MKLTWKKTLLALGAEVILCAIIIILGSLYVTQYFKYQVFNPAKDVIQYVKDYYRYDKQKMLAANKKDALYISIKMLETPDGGVILFSACMEINNKNNSTSVIKLDKNLRQLWEKQIPGYTQPIWSDAGFDGENYHLISTDWADAAQNVRIMSISPEGEMLANRKVEGDFVGKGYNVWQLLTAGQSAYIFSQGYKVKQQCLTEVDVNTGKIIRARTLPLYKAELMVKQAKFDYRNKVAYFAETEMNYRSPKNKGSNVQVWKYDDSGKFARIINQEFPQKVAVGLCMEDMPYLVTSTANDSGEKGNATTVYAIKDDKLELVWSYAGGEKSLNKMQCLKVGNVWYIGDMHGKESRPGPAVTKFDQTGNLITQTTLRPSTWAWFIQLLEAKDGRVLVSGTGTYAFRRYPRPYVSVVK